MEDQSFDIEIVKPKVWNFEVVGGNDAWKEVVYSARVSGVPPSVKDKKVFEMIVKNYYGSTLEHIIIKFDIKISKGNAPEFLEHRIVSHTGQSTRYVKADRGVHAKTHQYEVILPLHLIKNKDDADVILDGMRKAIQAYDQTISQGIPKEVARYSLPFGQAVGIYHVTLNLRSFLNMLALRLCVRSSPEFRSVAAQMYFKLLEELPLMKGLVGCRGFMRGVCPEGGVTGVRTGKQHPFYPPCPFKNKASPLYIPTNQEAEKAEKSQAFDRERAIRAQEAIFERWAAWG
ncbi:MAG: FAD-dependent thymidylate synthase [Candidatus Nealsonbacteria bacterium]|nr:FAD-dependent thymidylate synthase [Candidatus Nealsonbacteria bacterium]